MVIDMATTNVQVRIEVPRTALSALRARPGDFVSEMRLAAAVKWYEVGRISQAKAAELAGVTRAAFINALAQFRVSPFQATPDELKAEMTRP